MKELTFIEVMANIKDGEIWENENQRVARIYINKLGNVQLEGDDIDFACVDFNAKYKLKRKKYSFTEAFKAYEKGKEIESCINSDWHYKLGECELLVYAKEIKGEWYIND